jgi:hypothetical protein
VRQAQPVFDDATALDTAVDRLDAATALGEDRVGPLLLPGALVATGLLRRHDNLPLGERQRQKAQVLQQLAARWPGRRRGLGNALVMRAAAVGGAQIAPRLCSPLGGRSFFVVSKSRAKMRKMVMSGNTGVFCCAQTWAPPRLTRCQSTRVQFVRGGYIVSGGAVQGDTPQHLQQARGVLSHSAYCGDAT